MRAMTRARIVLLLAALALPGCASRRPATGLFGEPEGKQTLTISVNNNNFNDAGVYLISDGGRRRLGSVTGKGSGTYTVTWTNSRVIQLEVDFIAGSTCTTRPIQVAPGDVLYDWRHKMLDLHGGLARRVNAYPE